MHATKIHGACTRITLQKTESNALPLMMKKKEWILRKDGETYGFSRSPQESGLFDPNVDEFTVSVMTPFLTPVVKVLQNVITWLLM